MPYDDIMGTPQRNPGGLYVPGGHTRPSTQTPVVKNMPEPRSGKGFNYGAAAGGLLGAAGLFGSLFSRPKESDFDYDPSRRAISRYYDLINPQSAYWRNMYSVTGKQFANAAPSTMSLLSLARAGGAGYGSANAIANQQAQAYNREGMGQAADYLERAQGQAEGQASQYLGMEYDRARTQTMGYQQAKGDDNFFDQLTGLGGGLLSLFL